VTDPRDEPTRELPAVTPSVSTAPPQSRWHWSAIPSHLGRARTSTVVLALLFLAVGALYLNVKPPTGTTTTGNETGVQQPVAPATVAPTRTVQPTTTETATETTSEETTTSRSTPSTSGTSGRTTTPRPTGSSATSSPARTSLPSLPTTGGAPTT
jgi:hypothetical protein